MKLQIAIDGPAAAGKTSTAQMLSQSLKIPYVNTGLLYRAMAYYYQKHGITETQDMIDNVNQEIQFSSHGGVLLNGEEIVDDLHTPEISQLASICSAIPEVRKHLADVQKDFAKHKSCIMEGRDIGTVIMPDASLKFYLTASMAARSSRRLKQLGKETPSSTDYKCIVRDLHERDERDTNRETAPLRQAEDAIYIDNSYMTLQQTFRIMNEIAYKKQTILEIMADNHKNCTGLLSETTGR